jgi:TolA-binding protein
MKRSSLKVLLGITVLLLAVSPVFAQSQGAAGAHNAAGELYSSGDFKAAAAAYEKLVKDYPTDAVIPSAQVQLAFSYYFLGQYDQALDMLNKATALPVLTPEVRQIVDGLRPQILAAKASNLPESDPKRKTTFEEAVKGFSDFITKYPQAPDIENALYSRAVSNYQIKKYDDAIKDLETNIQRFPNSGTIASSKNLLAGILALQAGTELSRGDNADKSKAFALYKRAADLLREIINKKEDIAIINEANYQLGQILMIQAGYSPKAEQPALYQQALEAFQAIAPKEQIIKWQEQKLKDFPGRRRAAAQAQNQPLLKQLASDYEREVRKMAELQGKADQTASALMKMAEIFFQQGKLNEARVILKHSQPFLADETDKKNLLYFMAMTYALQSAEDRAPAAYTAFQSAHSGDPIADNLPVTMGGMYLGLGNAQEAIRYYDESLKLYKDGRLAGVAAVQKAKAQTLLKNFPDAEKTFKDFLASKPSPEVAVIAQKGLADIYKDTGKWDEAIAAYKEVKSKFPDTEEAKESDYWIAIATQQKGDNAGAIPLLDAYIKANPKSVLAPLALYAKGSAQITVGQNNPAQKEEGIASLTTLAKEYPDSQPAPYTYFMIAQIRGQEGKTDELMTLMKAFVEKYPQDEKVYPAYEFMANSAIATANAPAALAAYREFLTKYPESPQAGEALYKIADLQRQAAEGLGRYSALNEQERSQWKTNIDGSIAADEEMIKKYPDSQSLALGLQTLLATQRLLIGAELKKQADVEAYFKALADGTSSPLAKSKILFALAAYVGEQDKPRALQIMSDAYKPDIVYSPQDYDAYGIALIEQKKLDEAAAVFDNLAQKYPVPAGVAANAAPLLVQEAQANALFGKGRIAQVQGQTVDAGKIFGQLKALYPWSPKVVEADFGISQSLKNEKKYDEALALLGAIIRNQKATADLRANSMLLGGDLMVEKMKLATDPKEKKAFLDAGIDYYIKIAQFYGGVPSVAAAGLWHGAQLLEEQSAGLTDPKQKTQQLDKAKGAYRDLLKEYPNSEFAPKAQERLKALGAP